ncbi:hypothetical protein EMIT053CA3_100032 [Pseudomonas donghuensis]
MQKASDSYLVNRHREQALRFIVRQGDATSTGGEARGGCTQHPLGGRAIARIGDPSIARAVGRIVPSGDSYLPLEPESQACIDAHGIPYSAW